MSLTKCIKKAGKALDRDDADAIRGLRDGLVTDGMASREAGIESVNLHIQDVLAEREALVEQIEEQGGAAPASPTLSNYEATDADRDDVVAGSGVAGPQAEVDGPRGSQADVGTAEPDAGPGTGDRGNAADGGQDAAGADAAADQKPALSTMSIDSLNSLRKFQNAKIETVNGWQVLDTSLPGLPSFLLARKIRQKNAAGGGSVSAESAGPFASRDDAVSWAKEGGAADQKPALSEPAAPIEDFGEVLEGARKDYAGKLEAAKDKDTAKVTLAESWPEPDYQNLLDSGVPAESVALIHAMRDEVPAKPRKGWKLRGWVEKLEAMRNLSSHLMNGTLDVARLKGMSDSNRIVEEVSGRADLYKEFGHSQSLKGISLNKVHWSMYGDQKNVTLWMINRGSSASAFGNMPRTIAQADTKEGAIEAFRKVHSKLGEEKAKGKKAVRFGIYQDSDTKEVFIGKKIGRDVARVKRNLDGVKAAREYMAENQAELESLLEKMKFIPSHRKETNAPRVGANHRNNGDVTPDEFTEAFGFRGVQFGNYVEQGRRQIDLNRAYDALLDLAGILEVPPKALSLNGELGLAFGARGKGGKGAAAAHYEPGTVVINLTKNEGAGSLAHEWFHALDNYFGRERGGKPSEGFATEGMASASTRPEVAAAMREVIKAVNRTGIRQRSKALDKVRTKAYWSTETEMAARAFESYVIEKLKDHTASNDYLANIVSEDYWRATEALGMEESNTFPYAEAAEIPEIRAAFDALFQVIETRETDLGEGRTGAELYSFAGESSATADRYSLAAAQRRIEAGASAETVRRDTGWFQWADGRWRYEIDDSQAQLIDPPIMESWEVWFSDKEKEKYGPRVSPSQMKAAEYKAYLKFRSEMQSEYDRLNGTRSLSDLLDHPMLFAAYDLAGIQVSFVKGSVSRGAYSPGRDTIELSLDREQDSEILSTLLHEIQHAIQEREGFARGGNADSEFAGSVKNALGALADGTKEDISRWKWRNDWKIKASEKAAEVARNGLKYESAQRLLEYSRHDKPSGQLRHIRSNMQWLYDDGFRGNDAANELQRDWWSLPKRHKMAQRNDFLRGMAFRAHEVLMDSIPDEQISQFKNDHRTMRGMLNSLHREAQKYRANLKPLDDLRSRADRAATVRDASRYSSPYDLYLALAGEVEARNVQARQSLTESERRATPPSDTQDTKSYRAIVIYGGLEIDAPMASLPNAAAKQSPANAHDTTSLTDSMNRAFPGVFAALEKAGLARIVTRDQMPAGVDTAESVSSKGRVLAYVQNGVVTFVADNIAKGHNVKGLMLHEVGVHLRQLGHGDAEFQSILKQFEGLANIPGSNAAMALSRVPEGTAAHLRTEEALGYFVENNSTVPLAKRLTDWFRAQLKQWLGSLKGLERTRMMKWANELTESDLITMATQAVKSAPAATRQPAGREAMASAARDKWYRSALADTVRGMGKIADKNGMVLPNQAKLWLMSQQKQGSFKQDEMEWSGLSEWLDMQTGKVSVEAISDYMEAGGVQVEDVVLGSDGYYPDGTFLHPQTGDVDTLDGWRENIDPDELSESGMTEDEALAELIDVSGEPVEIGAKATSAKYDGYALPGGENYREVLLTLPQSRKLTASEQAEYDELNSRPAVDLTEQERRRVNRLMDAKAGRLSPYRSSHWDTPGVLAHIRMNDRTDADGNKVLFIEEIQSDWAQDGRKQGFIKGPLHEQPMVATVNNSADQPYWEVRTESGVFVANIVDIEAIPGDEWRMQMAIDSARRAAKVRETDRGVPTAPFVGNTKSWTALAMKRIVALAVEGGYDKVAFVNGEQSAERYDLSKKVGALEYTKVGDGQYQVFVSDLADVGIMDQTLSESELDANFGKDVAEKIVQGGNSGRLSGDGLRVGGEGMKSFYDQIVPQVARDVLKKTGGGKLETFSTGESTAKEMGDFLESVGRKQESVEAAGNNISFTITDAMRQKVQEGLPLFSRQGQADPGSSDILFSRADDAPIGFAGGPRVESKVSAILKTRAFFESASDTLSRSPGLESLGEAVRVYYDRIQANRGAVSKPERKASNTLDDLPRAVRKKVLADFATHRAAVENGRASEAAAVLKDANPALETLIESWQAMADITGDMARDAGVMVQDAESGEWRPMGKVKNFWPRTFSEAVQNALDAPHKHIEKWNELVDAIYATGKHETLEDAANYLIRYRNDMTADATESDYFAGIEKGRSEPLPELFYDYSWDGGLLYKESWADRLAQIQAFGQAYGSNKDAFDQALEGVRDDHTRNFIGRIQQRAYNQKIDEPLVNAMQWLNTAATGLQLGNPGTAVLNLFSGMGLTAMSYGAGRSLLELGKMVKSVKSFKNQRDLAYDLGVLKEDYLNILHDAERSGVPKWLRQSTSTLMKVGGYTPTEHFIRLHALAVGQNMLRDSLKTFNAKPGSKKAAKYAKWFQSNNFDVDRLVQENGKGEYTNRFLRYAANLPQGSYKVDQTPIYVDTPIGRFLFKYQKFGTQLSRMFWKNHLRPFVKSISGGEQTTYTVNGHEYSARVYHFAPLLRFFAVSAGAGMMVMDWREELFGYQNKAPTWDEIEKALEDDDTAKAFALGAERAFQGFLAAGGIGMFSNYAQMAYDVADQQRVKNPLDPPALAPLKAFAEIGMRVVDQGELTKRDLDNFIQGNVALYRTAKRAAADPLSELTDFREPQFEAAKKDVAFVKKMTRRFAAETGLKGKRRSVGVFSATKNTVFNNEIYEALLLGEPGRARLLAREHFQDRERFPTPKDRRDAMLSLKSSLRARDPARVGVAPSEAERRAFIRWAQENTTATEYARIRRVADDYRRATARAGLL